MIPRLYSLELINEKEITTTYKGIYIDVPKNCDVIDIDFYDVGKLGETKVLNRIKFYKKEIESDEDFEKRKKELKEKYHQEYLEKLKELENDK